MLIKLGLFLGAIVIAVTVVTAAPRPREPIDLDSIDLSAIHNLIAKAQSGTAFPVGSLIQVKESLYQLLDQMGSQPAPPSGFPEDWKLPSILDQSGAVNVVETAELIGKKNALAVGQKGKVVQSSFSVILVAGDAEIIQSDHCVIFAGGTIKAIQSTNCIMVANKKVDMTQCHPRKKNGVTVPTGTIAIAGERLTCSQSGVVMGTVLRPAKDQRAVKSSQCSDMLFLNDPSDWDSSQDTKCRAMLPEYLIAK